MANDKFTVVGTNIAEKATIIWNVADMLRGPLKPHEYGLVILLQRISIHILNMRFFFMLLTREYPGLV